MIKGRDQKMKTKGKMIAYWTVTSLLAVSITLSGMGQLMKYGGNIELVNDMVNPSTK